jgi:hypothetical protein
MEEPNVIRIEEGVQELQEFGSSGETGINCHG